MTNTGNISKKENKKAIIKPAKIIKDTGKKVSSGASRVKANTLKNVPKITPEQMGNVLDACYDKALNGIPNVSKPVEVLAEDYLSKFNDPVKATNSLINNQLVKCTTSGFLAGLGGLITLPVTIPANLSSVMYVQLRMIAAIATLGGYDPSSDQVQTLAYACLTGQAIESILKNAGIKIGNKLAINGITKISGATLTKINQAVGFRLITKFGQTGVINMGKAVPVVGGIIGGSFDLLTTKIIANNACRIFLGTEYDDSELNKELSSVNAPASQVSSNRIFVPSSSKKYIGRYYKDVANELHDAGFENIICSNIADLKKGWIAKEGTIARISIAGQTEFKKDTAFLKNDNVRIMYHTYK